MKRLVLIASLLGFAVYMNPAIAKDTSEHLTAQKIRCLTAAKKLRLRIFTAISVRNSWRSACPRKLMTEKRNLPNSRKKWSSAARRLKRKHWRASFARSVFCDGRIHVYGKTQERGNQNQTFHNQSLKRLQRSWYLLCNSLEVKALGKNPRLSMKTSVLIFLPRRVISFLCLIVLPLNIGFFLSLLRKSAVFSL